MIIEKSYLTKLLPNLSIDSHKKHLSLMGIEEIFSKKGDPKIFTLNIHSFLYSALLNASPKKSFEDKVKFAFELFDINSIGFFGYEEVLEMLLMCNEVNSLSIDSNLIKLISEIILEALDKDKTGKITRENLKDFLEKYQTKNLKFNAFGKDRTMSFKRYQ